jgi:streptomycin 3"-adenylyltransferase
VPELLGEQATDTRNVLRTLARGRHSLATGEIRSKDAAAEWAVVRLRARGRTVGGVDAGGCAEYLVRMIGERQPA